MNYTNQSYQNKITDIVSLYPQFKIVEKSDELKAHNILEGQGMQLMKNMQLTYSRRPDLWKSFSDSNQKALIFYEKDHLTTIAAFSESESFYQKSKILNYYSSDLRMTPKATMKIRKDFREVYLKIISELPENSICSTAILKDNLKAMNAFTRGSTSLFYNVLFEYIIRTVVILPSIYFNKRIQLRNYKTEELREDLVEDLKFFLEMKQSQANFSNDLLASRKNKHKASEFIILKDNQIHGYFALHRPASRSIYVKTTSRWIKFLLKLLSIFSATDLSIKLPWVYLTSLVLNDELHREPKLISYVIQHLFHSKSLISGELLLMLHPKNHNTEGAQDKSILKCPQVINTGVFFRVESKKEDRQLQGFIHIDPSEI